MRGMVPHDPLGSASDIEFAVVYVPRRSRNRFPAGCVTIKPCAADALDDADEDSNLYAARVSGPSKSSEGQYIFYLLEWLK